MRYLEKTGLEVVGIFRRSAGLTQVLEIKKSVNRGEITVHQLIVTSGLSDTCLVYTTLPFESPSLSGVQFYMICPMPGLCDTFVENKSPHIQ